jgi:hypothetical protein
MYQRSFTGGLVLVNPTTASKSETLPTGHTWSNSAGGAKVGPTITLAAHTATILLG